MKDQFTSFVFNYMGHAPIHTHATALPVYPRNVALVIGSMNSTFIIRNVYSQGIHRQDQCEQINLFPPSIAPMYAYVYVWM